jgi:hypothetical protein
MLIFKGFTGINNVVPEMRMSGADAVAALDVDIGLTGEITRRSGFSEVADTCHKNIFDAHGGVRLSTSGSTLIATHPNDDVHVIHEAIGSNRVWYCNLPDGRTTFTNGLINGITDGFEGFEHSISMPTSLGSTDFAFGELDLGSYRYALTRVRMSDGAESPALVSEPFQISNGGLRLDGLPIDLGYALNVYLTQKEGEKFFLVGNTTGSTFEWGGKNAQLILPCRTVGAVAFPVGTYTTFWRGRVLTAYGNVLGASRPMTPHLADYTDFKQFASNITSLQAVDDGVYVGTEEDLIFLSGETWDGLTYARMQRGPVTPGSGTPAPGDRVKLGKGTGTGSAMMCIAGGLVVAGFNGGVTECLTEDRYATSAAEVCAIFRELNGVPQYVAVPQ